MSGAKQQIDLRSPMADAFYRSFGVDRRPAPQACTDAQDQARRQHRDPTRQVVSALARDKPAWRNASEA